MSGIKKFRYDHTFHLESGESLPAVEIAYQTWGELTPEKDNVVLVCHALTGNSEVADYYDKDGNYHEGWWREFIGKGKTIDTDQYFVICTNVIGSCYGSTGPTSIDPSTNKAYKMNFPVITIKDMVTAQSLLINNIGIDQIDTVIGGSLGGMQALEWAVAFPEKVKKLVMIAAPLSHSAWAIGLNEIGRQTIMNDPVWNEGNYTSQPEKGLKQARMLAMMSYRSHQSYKQRFGRSERGPLTGQPINGKTQFEIESYLHYQGEKLVSRFDANSYLYLTKALDLFDISKDRGDRQQALSRIRAKTLIVGISSDLLYPVSEIKEICQYQPGFLFGEIESVHGHDAFLIETAQLSNIVEKFLIMRPKKQYQPA